VALLARLPASAVEPARAAVLAYGWNATSYQVLNPGIEHWFAHDGSALVGYTRRGRVLLVAGAPLCPEQALPSVCREFESFARTLRCRVCYVCAEQRLASLLRHIPSHAAIALGAQPSWDPRTWPQIVDSRASLRAQLNRARNKDVVVESVSVERAAANQELRCVLHEWLNGRTLPPLHFLVEPNILDGELHDRIILLARRRDEPVAFLVASPVRARNGYLVELLARTAAAPNGTSELLIDAAMRRFASEGRGYATLGLVALTHAAEEEMRFNPAWLRVLLRFARAHANRFYNFRGLEQFRVKLAPQQWEPIYAISNERHFSPATLYAIGAAFSGIAPWAAVAIGIAKAARDELRNALAHRRPGSQ
jgi:phosphatidylglycerol lysyltransferase